jgi:6-phosphogluconolactonase
VSGQRQIVIVPDARSLAETAARRLIARIGEAVGAVAICLTGGPTPQPLYQLLAIEPWRSTIAWERTHWFIGDDRFVPSDHALSNMGIARQLFLDRVPVPAGNIHPIPTHAASPDAAARLYEAELKCFYGREQLDPARRLFALVLMGPGSDGHCASLFPGTPALAEGERWVLGVDQAKLAPFVPRVTLTFPALASTREMLFLVSGAEKRVILARVLSGKHDLPASRAYSHGDLVWLVERAAAPEKLDAR